MGFAWAVGGLAETLLAAAHACLALAAAMHALLSKPDPRSAFGWIAVVMLFPFAGPMLYYLFGINRVRARAKTLRTPEVLALNSRSVTSHPQDSPLKRIGDAITQWPCVGGNSVEPLFDAEHAFGSMLAAIETAQRSVWLATYIFETDAVGRGFIRALAAAQARGVAVRVLIDGVGEWYSWPHSVALLRRCGVRAARFLPPQLLPPRISLNLRNHRKLLVVDGHTCFVGGMNIGGRELATARGGGMRDLHCKVSGAVTVHFAAAFATDWAFVSKERLTLPEAVQPRGESLCRVVTDGPDEDVDKLLLIIVGAVSAAVQRVIIMTPYFVPPPELVAALQAAALRGIDVSILIPARSNLRYVDWATRRWLPPLLERGVRVFLQPPPFAHTKLLVVDSEYVQIGSANIDQRSLRLNFEIAMEIYDPAICVQLAGFAQGAIAKSSAFTLQDAERRTFPARLRDSLFWLLSPYL